MKVVERQIGSLFGEEELTAIRNVITSGESPSWGPERGAFESDFAAYVGAKHAVAMSSCTAALSVCAQILRLKEGDEIISTPQSFWPTISGPVQRGVRVRFADVEPSTLNVDPKTIEPLITPRTRALYILHYGGAPAELETIRAIAKANRLVLVEDCAHAVGAEYRGRKIGDGELCCFSFQALKNMTTLGEGGMITTANDDWAKEARLLRALGVLGKHHTRAKPGFGPYPPPVSPFADHSGFPLVSLDFSQNNWNKDVTEVEELGTKCYLSAIQAAVGRVQLRKLDGMIETRARIAARMDEAIASIPGLRTISPSPMSKSSRHLYVCAVTDGIDRDRMIQELQEVHGIQIVNRFWPLHLTSVLRAQGHQLGEAPVCERVWFKEQIGLPIHPAMADSEVDAVIQALADSAKKLRR